VKLNLAAANDDRPQIDAEFLLPHIFVSTYNQELLRWASSGGGMSQTLEIDLWGPPDSTILSVGYQGTATLRCETVADKNTGSILFVIGPADQEQDERVKLHCEALPAILAQHRRRAEAMKNMPRGRARAEFNLPEYFVKRYGLELREWGRNLKQIGLTKTIVLREGTLSDISPAEDQGAVLRGVKLKAEIERLKGDEMRLIISCATEADERIMRNHVQKMTSRGIPAVAELVEPVRPGMPFMPTVAGAKRNADGGI
jgi:hypothetical protein